MKQLLKKKTYLILAIILLAAGAAVGTGGFALAHFHVDELPQTVDHPWYQTVAVSSGRIWFGVELWDGAVSISSGEIPAAPEAPEIPAAPEG